MEKPYLNTVCDLLAAIHQHDMEGIIIIAENLIKLVTDNRFPKQEERDICYDLQAELEDELNTDWQDDEESVD
jgi:hypothetical protein